MSDIDPAVLEQLAADVTAADLRTVLSASEADLLRMSGILLAAAHAGDAAAIHRAAHTIAGVAGIVGARSLEAEVRALMESGAAPSPAIVQEAARIVGHANAVVHAVRHFMTTRGYDA